MGDVGHPGMLEHRRLWKAWLEASLLLGLPPLSGAGDCV